MTKLESASPHKTALMLASTFLLSAIASCSNTVSQCKQFADITQQNQTLRSEFEEDLGDAQIMISSAQNISDTQQAAGRYISVINATASEIDEMVQSLSSIDITDEQLAEYRESYVITLTGSKAALDSASDAMQLVRDAKTEEALRKVFNAHQEQGTRAYNQYLAANSQEAPLIEQINTYCAEPPQ